MREQGFTILEVLVAISILTVGLLAIASLQGYALNGNAQAGAITGAVAVVSDRAEKLAALPLDAPELSDADSDGVDGLGDTGFDNNPFTTFDADFADLGVKSGHLSYDVYWNVAEDEPKHGNKKIQIIVTWTWKGQEKSLSLVSIR